MTFILRLLGFLCCVAITVIIIGLAIIVVSVAKEFINDRKWKNKTILTDKRKGGKR